MHVLAEVAVHVVAFVIDMVIVIIAFGLIARVRRIVAGFISRGRSTVDDNRKTEQSELQERVDLTFKSFNDSLAFSAPENFPFHIQRLHDSMKDIVAQAELTSAP
jgi:hypothetical protein